MEEGNHDDRPKILFRLPQLAAQRPRKPGPDLPAWSVIGLMCSKCLHGAPQDGHDHIPATSDAKPLGLAGHKSELGEVMETWLAGRHGIDVLHLNLLW